MILFQRELQPFFHLFKYIVNNKAASVVHKHSEEATGKFRLMQAGKFTAFCEAMFVNTAAVGI